MGVKLVFRKFNSPEEFEAAYAVIRERMAKRRKWAKKALQVSEETLRSRYTR